MADVQRQQWTAEQYFADSRTSRSDLELYRSSPRTYFRRKIAKTLAEPEPSAAMRLGTMLHAAALEPEVWKRVAVDKPKFTGDGARARQAAWEAGLFAGAMVVAPKERAAVDGMLAALQHGKSKAAQLARGLLWGAGGESEVAITWRDEDEKLAHPIERRARLDRLCTRKGSLVVDLKTTDDPSPEAFAKSIFNHGYHRQAGFYCEAALALVGSSLPRFAFVVVRSEPPHEVAVYELEPEAISLGQQEVRESLRALSRSLAENDWSAPWENGPMKINLPFWARRAAAQKEKNA